MSDEAANSNSAIKDVKWSGRSAAVTHTAINKPWERADDWRISPACCVFLKEYFPNTPPPPSCSSIFLFSFFFYYFIWRENNIATVGEGSFG